MTTTAVSGSTAAGTTLGGAIALGAGASTSTVGAIAAAETAVLAVGEAAAIAAANTAAATAVTTATTVTAAAGGGAAGGATLGGAAAVLSGPVGWVLGGILAVTLIVGATVATGGLGTAPAVVAEGLDENDGLLANNLAGELDLPSAF